MKVIIDEVKPNFKEVYDRNIDTVYRICFMHLKGNKANAEDAVQNTFLQFLKKQQVFDSLDHEKAWFITVASNICKNMLKSKANKNISLDGMGSDVMDNRKEENKEILECIFSLPDKYKTVIYMHYYEGYSCVEIANMLGIKENTIYSYLSKGRELLKDKLKEELYE